MFKSRFFTHAFFVMPALLSMPSPAQEVAIEVNDLLAKADKFRLSVDHARIVIDIQVYENGSPASQHKYHVYSRPPRESLVIFKAASEEGQKVLMLQDKFWLLMPRSRRPIRITPMQKLLGNASVGDVSSLTWSEDYHGVLSDEVLLAGTPARKLVLDAKTKGASYHKINLWVDKSDAFPLRAELYLRSGKLAKVAHFDAGILDGKKAVSQMRLVDVIQTNRETLVTYKSIEAFELPEKYYNPAYLSRQSVVHL